MTKLGTYLALKRIWNPIDFQGQRSRSPGQIFRWGDTPHFALPLFYFLIRIMWSCWQGIILVGISRVKYWQKEQMMNKRSNSYQLYDDLFVWCFILENIVVIISLWQKWHWSFRIPLTIVITFVIFPLQIFKIKFFIHSDTYTV